MSIKMENNNESDTETRSSVVAGPSPNCKFGPKASLYKCMENPNSISIPYAANHKLTWESPPKMVLVVKKIGDPTLNEKFCQLISLLIDQYGMYIMVEKNVLNDQGLKNLNIFNKYQANILTYQNNLCDLNDKVDFIVSLGGDGTLLYASSLFQETVPPIMAFHLGSLGFLAPFDFSDYKDHISRVLQGNCLLTLRSRLKCHINTADETDPSKSTTNVKNILNEITIDRGISPYLCTLELYIEKLLITTVQGDGLIIATPTGSTAYACAAGSSMVHPAIPAIVITPICAHSLSFRPIVIPAGVNIRVTLAPQSRDSVWSSYDGQYRKELKVGDSLDITASIYPIPSICYHNQISDWFTALKKSLHWNERLVQKALEK